MDEIQLACCVSDLPDEIQLACYVNDLPDEILECIFTLTSPYRDFKSMMLVCRRWHTVITGVIGRHFQQFQKAVSTGGLTWSWHQPVVGGPTITERYSHSACYYDRALYVFGGCTSTATTFNDLWKFDLVEERWFRPLATGSYPSPKAWATMVAYKDSLILFGGWSYPTPITFHQASRFFNQLHLYHPGMNHWTQVTSQNCPEGKAGHGASIIGDSMVVFGGSHGFENSCNDILVLDLKEMTWRKQPTSENKPRPRYSHSQVVIDEHHILIFGGCGGANMQFSDAWLLTLNICGGPGAVWTWQELSIANSDLAAPQLWCHPACKVGDKLVILSKNPKVFKWDVSQALANPQVRPASRHCTPPHQLRIPAKNKPGQTGSRADSKRSDSQGSTSTKHESDERGAASSSSERVDRSCEASASEASSSVCTETAASLSSLPSSVPSSVSSPSASNLPLPSASSAPTASSSAAAASASTSPPPSASLSPSVRSGMPCVRPNAMKNRQHQLETLKKYEQKFRAAAHQSNPLAPSPHLPGPSADLALRRSSLNPICIHTVDLGRVLTDCAISWLPIKKPDCVISPEETIFYSLVEGRGELIMFGGIRGDLHTMQRGLQLKTQAVSNTIHYLSYMQHID